MSTTTKPTSAALRAAEAIYNTAMDGVPEFYDFPKAALAIDRITGLPELIDALSSNYVICFFCRHPIGWNEPFDPQKDIRDWSRCSTCQPARAALAKARGV